MNKKIFLGISAVFLIVLIAVLVRSFDGKPFAGKVESFADCVSAGYPVMESYPRRCSVPGGQSFTEDLGNELEKVDLIRLDSPRPNGLVGNPVTLSGQARGVWYFEASAPVEIQDANGKVLGVSFIQATSDWMTEEFVPFQGELSFTVPETKTGKLVLRKDNPSGLPEHDDALIVPIVFSN